MSNATLDALRAREQAKRPVQKPKRGKVKDETPIQEIPEETPEPDKDEPE